MSTQSKRMMMIVLVGLLLVIHPESGNLPAGPIDVFSNAASQAQGVETRSITYPVVGPSNYGDTWGACRDNCARTHEGVDIFAPPLAPLVAAVDGLVVSERRNATGNPGNRITIEDADGWRYRYFHLNNDNPGTDDNANPQAWILATDLRAGDRVRAGDLIGYLGDSGNAETTPPHLHFEIRRPSGAPINPTPSVDAARAADAVVSSAEFVADDDERDEWTDLVEDHYLDLAGRSPTDDELDAWTNRLALGLGTEAELIGDLALSALHREPEGAALRTYVATFSRLPTPGALDLLTEAARDGGTIDDLADLIVASFAYQNLSGPPDREEIVRLGSSTDIKLDTWHLFQVVRAYRAAAGRLPDGDEIDAWIEYLEAGGLLVDVVEGALDGELPSGGPRHADAFTASEHGWEPGVNVRQGPIDLAPEGEPIDGTRTDLEPSEVEFELTVVQGDDSDTANLVVQIPLDELADRGGDAELTIELSLNQPADGDADAEADADVRLVIDEPDPSTQPTVRTPTTRATTTTTRSGTTAAPTTTAAAPAPTAAPTAPAPSTTEPPTTPDPSTTECPTPDPTAPGPTAADPTTTTGSDDSSDNSTTGSATTSTAASTTTAPPASDDPATVTESCPTSTTAETPTAETPTAETPAAETPTTDPTSSTAETSTTAQGGG